MKINPSLLAIPLTTLALGIFIVPFAVWNTDHAAQFFGAFVAALATAIAAFSGFFIQHKLSEEREQKAENKRQLTEVVELFFWLRYIQVSLVRAVKALDKRIEQEDQPPRR